MKTTVRFSTPHPNIFVLAMPIARYSMSRRQWPTVTSPCDWTLANARRSQWQAKHSPTAPGDVTRLSSGRANQLEHKQRGTSRNVSCTDAATEKCSRSHATVGRHFGGPGAKRQASSAPNVSDFRDFDLLERFARVIFCILGFSFTQQGCWPDTNREYGLSWQMCQRPISSRAREHLVPHRIPLQSRHLTNRVNFVKATTAFPKGDDCTLVRKSATVHKRSKLAVMSVGSFTAAVYSTCNQTSMLRLLETTTFQHCYIVRTSG